MEAEKGVASLLLVEDDPLLRNIYGWLLTRPTGLHLLDAKTVAEGRRLVEQHRASIQVAVIDYMLPDGNGMEIVRLLGNSDTRVILHTGYTDAASLELDHYPNVMLISKDTPGEELRAAVRGVVLRHPSPPRRSPSDSGSGLLVKVAGQELPKAWGAWEQSRRLGWLRSAAQLTDKELETVVLAAEDRTNAEIGEMLGLSAAAIKARLARAYRRLELSSRVQLKMLLD